MQQVSPCLCSLPTLPLGPGSFVPTVLRAAPQQAQGKPWGGVSGWCSANPSTLQPRDNEQSHEYSRGAPSAISMAVIPRDHKSLCERKQRDIASGRRNAHIYLPCSQVSLSPESPEGSEQCTYLGNFDFMPVTLFLPASPLPTGTPESQLLSHQQQ